MTDNHSNQAEDARAIAADYANLFGSPTGRRVLEHLLDLLGDGKAHGLLNITPERAIYVLARKDAAETIKAIIGRSFDPTMRPVVRTTSRFRPQPLPN